MRINKKYSWSIFVAILVFTTGISCTLLIKSNTDIGVVPQPKQIEIKGKTLSFSKHVNIKADVLLKNEVEYLRSTLQNQIGTSSVEIKSKSLNISLKSDSSIHQNNEAYLLSIDKTGVTITGQSDRGCFYGIQTLIQLLETEGEKIYLPEIEIFDYPKYAWRSYMLDESRYFFGKEFVLKMLDELAALKVNKFHWHLTDDAGWRIEIKKYPLLTEIGSIRDSSKIEDKVNGIRFGTKLYDGKPHGGFYTQEEIKELIDYAKKLHIDIIPEIEMPGHCSAAIVAYPWLGIIGELNKVPTFFGKHKDSYNIADPKVIEFLHDVLDEVCELFPYEVVHIGGDEVLFGAWEKSKEIQEYIKKHQLKGPADAQIKFTNDISVYLEGKGKRMMGWNEIMGHNVHGFDNVNDYKVGTSLSDKTIIHFWQGKKELVKEAAIKGHDIVYSGAGDTYLDYYYKNVTLEKVYHMQPVPDSLDAKYAEKIIGVGVQMWTEWAPTYKDVEYKTFPRVAGFAETTWSGAGDYTDFIKRLTSYSKRWKAKGINFPVEQIK